MFKLEANLNEEILDREVGTTGYDISKKEWITSSKKSSKTKEIFDNKKNISLEISFILLLSNQCTYIDKNGFPLIPKIVFVLIMR